MTVQTTIAIEIEASSSGIARTKAYRLWSEEGDGRFNIKHTDAKIDAVRKIT
jgi:hypothetical protein